MFGFLLFSYSEPVNWLIIKVSFVSLELVDM